MPTIGLVGCGLWGRNILRALIDLGADVSVAEPEAACRTWLAADFGIGSVADAAALGPVDGLIVATPASTHADMVLSLLDRGVPIFVEKPLTTDAEAARALAPAADRVFVMHVWRYHPGVETLAAIAQGGELGAVTKVRTVRTGWTSPRTDVDSLWTLAPHDVTIVEAILGHIPEPVFAEAEIVRGRAVGMVAVLGRAAPRAIVEVSNRYADKRREVRVHGELGVAVLADDHATAVDIHMEDAASPSGRTSRSVRVDDEPPLRREVEAFLRYLQGGPPPPTDYAEGVRVVETIDRLRRLAGLT